MPGRFTGQVAIVTAGGSGIGAATARRFAAEGAAVVIADLSGTRAEAVASSITTGGGRAAAIKMDASDPAAMRRTLQLALDTFGRLDVMVNNAGAGVRGSVEETPLEDYRRLMEVNYLGTVHGCRAALPVMKRQGRGVIINVSSIVGHRALAGGAAYAATKAAQISLTESLRMELRGTGIAACSVHPVSTETEFAEVAARASAGRKGGPVGPRQSADAVARAIVACARRPRPEVYPYRLSRAIVWLNALAPGLVDWLASRATPKSR